MAELSARYQSRLGALRDAYVAQLPLRLQAMREAASASVAAWPPESGDPEPLRALVYLSHRLAGSAAIFGFAEISRAALELEAAASGLLAHAGTGGPRVLEGRLARIEAAAGASRNGG